MQELSRVWPQMKYYLDNGINIMPVWDRDFEKNGDKIYAKSPCGKWKYLQSEFNTFDSLYKQLDFHDTTAVGIICGKISRNLEIIDVDVKNWLGIDAQLFADINSFYPDIFSRLRIHKTPSGGYHILYRISDHGPQGNRKLAYKSEAKEAAIETRGEGGYVAAPPALNYSVFKDNPIPVITWAERCAIISLCESYNEKVKVVEAVTKSKQHNDYYSVNPFEHYNNSSEGALILEANGWKRIKESTKFVWYTRPGKEQGISASFNKERNMFYIFTSSTALENGRGYTPSSVFAILNHNNDKKAAFADLRSKGFGKIKPEKEKLSAQKLARLNIAPPPNFSEDGLKLYNETLEKLKQDHPFGVFWKINDEDRYEISRDALTRVASELGYRLYKGELIQLTGQIFYNRSEREIQDSLKEYIKEEDADHYERIINAYEAFMQKNGRYTISRLPILQRESVISDSPDKCFKFFTNGVVLITADGISYGDYHELEDKFIPASKIQQREYGYKEGGLYLDFLQKATNWTEQSEHIKRCIGYLSHEYKDETTGYIIVLTEQCVDPKEGGGSGKNLFCNLLSNTTTYHSKNGSQVKFDEKFFQSWNGQRLMGISDVPDNFNFQFLKEPSTGTFILKKLFKDEVEVPVQDGPKFIVQTNFSYELTDGGLRRRIVHIEFTDFFTKSGGVDAHYKKHFTRDWTSEDWWGYDSLIIESVQSWLKSGKKLSNTELTKTGWEKQFIHSFGRVACDLVYEFINGWIEMGQVDISQINAQITTYFNENNIGMKYQPSRIKTNKAIEYWCKHNGIDCDLAKVIKDLGVPRKVAVFKVKD